MEAYNPDCLLPIVKHGCGSVMVWEAISWNSRCPIVVLHSRINTKDCLNILGDHAYSMVQSLLHDGDGILSDTYCSCG